MENWLIMGPQYSAHTCRRWEVEEAPRGSLVVVKRWEGRGAPLCAKFMRFRIVLINSRCSAESRPPPEMTESLLGLAFSCLAVWVQPKRPDGAPRSRAQVAPRRNALTQVPPLFVSFYGFNLKDSTMSWGAKAPELDLVATFCSRQGQRFAG